MNSNLFKIQIPLSINFLRKIAGVNPLIVNYHVVADESLPHIKHIYKYRSKKNFADDLNILKKYYYPIGLHTFLESIKNKKRLPENSLLLTIDDGLKEIYTNMAPILLEKKIPATIFLTKNYIDNYELGSDHKKSLLIERLLTLKTNEVQSLLKKYNLSNNLTSAIDASIIGISYKNKELVDELATEVSLNFNDYLIKNKPYITSDQINELISQGFTIGGHSIDHPEFAELCLSDQVRQAIDSIDYVCSKFSLDYRVFAFPYHDAGVSHEFFKTLEKDVDATFGTQGLLTDSAKLNHQRIGIERYFYPLKRMIKVHYARRIIYKLLNKTIINRN